MRRELLSPTGQVPLDAVCARPELHLSSSLMLREQPSNANHALRATSNQTHPPPSVSRVRVAPLLAPLGAQHAIYVRKALTSRIQLRPPVSHVVLPNQQFYKALRLQQTALTRRPPTLPEVNLSVMQTS